MSASRRESLGRRDSISRRDSSREVQQEQQGQDSKTTRALNLFWCYGFNPQTTGLHLIVNFKQKIVFYASSHVGVLYDINGKKQRQLKGHCNAITAIAASKDKRYIVTCDKGKNSMVIIWDIKPFKNNENSTFNEVSINDAIPVKTIYDPHHETGVIATEFTADSAWLITLGADSPQSLYIWDWTQAKEQPLMSIILDMEPQTCLKLSTASGNLEFMTNGTNTVAFYAIKDGNILKNSPLSGANEFKSTESQYTCSTFIGNYAATATVDGDLILWGDSSLDNLSIKLSAGQRAVTKCIKLHNSAINFIEVTSGKYLISGGQDGFVKVFDLKFRLLYWYERLRAGPILSIGLGSDNEPIFDDITIPEMIISTKQGELILLSRPDPKKDRPRTPKMPDTSSPGLLKNEVLSSESPEEVHILQGQYGEIHGLSSHPENNYFAVGGDAGLIQVFDYTNQTLVSSRQFETSETDPKAHQINCITYSQSGKTLAVGFSNGVIRMLDSATLKDLPQTTYGGGDVGHAVSKFAITKISFSFDGKYCAASDADNVIIVLHKESVKVKDPESSENNQGVSPFKRKDDQQAAKSVTKSAKLRMEWVLVGRAKCHFQEIVGLLFPKYPEGISRLYAVSHDRHVSEIDLMESSLHAGLKVLSIRRIEQIYRPLTAFLYHKPAEVHPEESIITFNDGFKIRTFTCETKLCRKTVLGPTFGTILNTMVPIPTVPERQELVAFSCTKQVIGLVVIPATGNPYDTMGVIAHADKVSNLASVRAGNYLISCGSKDSSIHQWEINPAAIESQVAIYKHSMDPFLNMLDPSGKMKDSPIYKEFEDYFYYAQLQDEGENQTNDRAVNNVIPLERIPSILQAMGYYASHQEIDDMINEIKYMRYSNGAGEEVSTINFNDLIKLYINHRPYNQVNAEELEASLAYSHYLYENDEGQKLEPPITLLSQSQKVQYDAIVSLLQQYGESMSLEEVQKAFSTLLSNSSAYAGPEDAEDSDKPILVPSSFTPNEFIGDLLGFEPKVSKRTNAGNNNLPTTSSATTSTDPDA